MAASSTAQLPGPQTELFGREDDIHAIATLVLSSHERLVTLAGPGGVGKTRLAIAVAKRLANQFEHGTVAIDLSTTVEPSQVAPAMLSALALLEEDDVDAQLAQALAGQTLLLVIDNFEQVLEAAPWLNALLARAPRVRALVTSRAPLDVTGERVYEVAPLPVPPSIQRIDLTGPARDTVSESPSVSLFAARARAVRPSFELTSDNLPAVVQICRQLDGLPLAIELAAARSRFLSPEALQLRLAASAQILRDGPRDAVERHRSLELAIGWSYGLLDPREALLLERLSIFAGSFALEAVETIAGNAPIEFAPTIYLEPMRPLPEDDRLQTSDILELVDRLVSHALVQRIDGEGVSQRFRLFETVRQFAADRLMERGDQEPMAERHVRYFRTQAEATWFADGSPVPEILWFSKLDQDRDNLRAALDYTDLRDPAAAASFAASLFWYFYCRLAWKEGSRAIARTEGRYDPTALPQAAHDRVECVLASLLSFFPETRPHALDRLAALGERASPDAPMWAAAYATVVEGIVRERSGEGLVAIAAIDRGRALLGPLDAHWTGANLRYHEALARFGRGEIERAKALAWDVVRTDPNVAGVNIAYAQHVLSLVSIAQEKPAEAARHIEAGLEFMTRYGLTSTWTEEIDTTAAIAAQAGDFEAAAVVFGSADRLHQEAGSPISLPERTLYDAHRTRTRDVLGADRFAACAERGHAQSRGATLALVRETLLRIEHAESPSPPTPIDAPYGLTSREIETLQLVVEGYTDREIAQRLQISHATARARVRSILAKLDVRSRTAATTLALREGIVSITGTD